MKEAENLLNLQKKHNSPDEMARAIAAESFAKLQKVTAGIARYTAIPKSERAVNKPVIWQSGSTRVIDYGNESADRTIIFIPSLINKSYIFDLSEKNSMIKYFTNQGIRCLLIDWGEPLNGEIGFGIGEYITERLIPALQHISDNIGAVMLAGYCMGGLMALATAQHMPQAVSSIALLATPWDFHSSDMRRISLQNNHIVKLRELFEQEETISGEIVHQLLYMADPFPVHNRYARFSTMDADSTEYNSFIERENWLHDNIPLTKKVATECFIDWAVDNIPCKMQWRVGGEIINPSKLNIPCIAAIPKNDSIVPSLCAKPLTDIIPSCKVASPHSGHISMVAGANAQKHLWKPLANWIDGL